MISINCAHFHRMSVLSFKPMLFHHIFKHFIIFHAFFFLFLRKFIYNTYIYLNAKKQSSGRRLVLSIKVLSIKLLFWRVSIGARNSGHIRGEFHGSTTDLGIRSWRTYGRSWGNRWECCWRVNLGLFWRLIDLKRMIILKSFNIYNPS